MATDRTRPSGKGSARIEDAGTPSRAEIQQRITSLYDRAENDSGTFNATRAMNNGSRRTVTSVANSPRRGSGDPSLEAVARQWFDVARNKIGPVTAAVLPADRMPERPTRPRPQEAAGSEALRELEAAARELSSRRELEAGERQPPELTGRSVAALPAVPSPRQEEPKALPAVPAPAQAALPAASGSASAPAAPQSSLRTSKEQIRRKLDTAREVLARGIAQSTAARPALEASPAAQTWDTGELPSYRAATTNTWDGHRPDGPTTGTGRFPTVGGPSAGQFPAVDMTGTGQFPTVDPTGTGQFAAVTTTGTGQFPTVDPTGTGQFAAVTTTGTGQFPTVGGLSTGQYPAVDMTGTGQFPTVGTTAGPTAPPTAPPAGAADPGLGAPVGGFPAPETGILAASYGDLLAPPATGLPPQQPQAPAPAQGFVLPTPQIPLPTTSYAPAAPEVTLPTPEYAQGMPAAAPGYAPNAPQAAAPTFAAPSPTPQAAPPAPAFAAAAPQTAPPAPAFAAAAPHVTLSAPGYAPAGPQAAVTAPGYAPQAAAPTAAQAPLPPAAVPAMSAMPAAPADVTAHTTGAVYLGRADKALAFARAQLGRPCVSGATGPESYDCSSLTQAAWRAAGVTLPRSAVDQARAFTSVGLDDLRAGDLVFFHDDLSHTGLCTGDGMMIHAPGPGARIREDSVHSLGEGALRGAVRPA
ncbi:C40 family peptidase [Streptomyces sp. NPDC101166]|uniref:C40 family peptidase n=1 Tax=Streptomyces sp. NPDC101166 TaxID=3366120 RepID=UPI0037FFE782